MRFLIPIVVLLFLSALPGCSEFDSDLLALCEGPDSEICMYVNEDPRFKSQLEAARLKRQQAVERSAKDDKQPVHATLSSSSAHELTISIGFPGAQVWEVRWGDRRFTEIHVPGTALAGQAHAAPGYPSVPLFHRLVAIPRGAEVSVRNFSITTGNLFEGVHLYPAQSEPLDSIGRLVEWPVGGKPQTPRPPLDYDREVYSRDARLPAKPVSVERLGRMRDLDLALVTVAAGQYNPAKRQLQLFEQVDLQLAFKGGRGCFLPAEARDAFEPAQLWPYHRALNAAQIEETFCKPDVTAPQHRGYEFLIITDAAFKNEARVLADWKQTRGLSTRVKETDVILKEMQEAGMTRPHRSNKADMLRKAIQAFLRDRFHNSEVRPSYVLLLGSSEQIPPWRQESPDGEIFVTDLDFALMHEGDRLPDLALGRIPVQTQSDAKAVIDRIIAYEKNPPTQSDFYQQPVLAAQFNCCRDGVDGASRSERGYVQTLEQLRKHLLTLGYRPEQLYALEPITAKVSLAGSEEDVYSRPIGSRYYDGQQLPLALGPLGEFHWQTDSRAMGKRLGEAMKVGRFLLVHRGHSSSDGWDSHGITKETLYHRVNTGSRSPVVFSLGSNGASFDAGAEAARDNAPFGQVLLQMDGGAVGVLGASGDVPTWATDAISLGFFDAIWPGLAGQENHLDRPPVRRLGDILNHGRLHMVNQVGLASAPGADVGGTGAANMMLFHLLGDPTLELWTEPPRGELPAGFGVENVHPGGLVLTYPKDGASITVLNDGHPLARGIVIDGRVDLDFRGVDNLDLDQEAIIAREFDRISAALDVFRGRQIHFIGPQPRLSVTHADGIEKSRIISGHSIIAEASEPTLLQIPGQPTSYHASQDTPVKLEVVDGPHEGLIIQGATDAEGLVELTYTGQDRGTDEVEICADFGTAGVICRTLDITWEPLIVFEKQHAENPAADGAEHTITAQVHPDLVEDTSSIYIQVLGPNGTGPNWLDPDDQGRASLSYEHSGGIRQDEIAVCLSHPDVPSGSGKDCIIGTKTWYPQIDVQSSSLALVGNSAPTVATVTDFTDGGNPQPDIELQYLVQGQALTYNWSATTDNMGKASLAFGYEQRGTTEIEVCKVMEPHAYCDTAFQAWESLRISNIEVSQGIQNLDNEMPLVEGRRTIARVYIENIDGGAPDLSNVHGYLRVGDGSPGVRAGNDPITVKADGGDRGELDDGFWFFVPAWATEGTTKLEAYVSLHEHFDPARHDTIMDWVQVPFHKPDWNKFQAWAVPFHLHEPGGAVRVLHYDDAAAEAIFPHMLRYFPVSELDIWGYSDIQYPNFHGLGREWDLTESRHRSYIVSRVHGLPSSIMKVNFPKAFWVGLVHEEIDTSIGGGGSAVGRARTPGYASWTLMNPSFDSSYPWYMDRGGTMGHEIGHNLGRKHALCSGNEKNTDSDYPWPHPDCRLTEIDEAGFFGLDVYFQELGFSEPQIIDNRSTGSGDLAYPLMGYEHPRWSDPYTYCVLLEKHGVPCKFSVDAGSPTVSAAGTAGDQGEVSEPAAAVELDTELSVWINGSLSPEQGEVVLDDLQRQPTEGLNQWQLDDWRARQAQRASETRPKTVWLHVLDSQQNRLHSQMAVLIEEEHDGLHDKQERFYGLSEFVPWPQGAVALAVEVDGELVEVRMFRSQAPQLSITNARVDSQERRFYIEWTADFPDPAGEPQPDLMLDLEFSPDNGRSWWPVRSRLEPDERRQDHFSGTLAGELGIVPGGTQTRLRIVAHDSHYQVDLEDGWQPPASPGDNYRPAIDVYAETFDVKALPPNVRILSPREGRFYSAGPRIGGDTLVLFGQASDLLSGSLGGRDLTWVSDRDGELGTGSELHLNACELQGGPHTLTLHARSPEGVSARASITIQVDEACKPPPDDIKKGQNRKDSAANNPENLRQR